MQEKVHLENKFINHHRFINWESYQEYSSVEGGLNTLHYLFQINKDAYVKVMEVIHPMQENRYDMLLYHSEVGMKTIENNLNTDEVLEELSHLIGVSNHELQ